MTFLIDGAPQTLSVAGSQALLTLPGQASGERTLTLVEPAGSAPAQIVVCP